MFCTEKRSCPLPAHRWISVGMWTFILLIIIALNVMMLFYHYEPWTNPKAGFWSAFWNRFEVSGFDPYTYIVISKWRPLYILSRHPLLAFMMWPLSQLNGWLIDVTGINCAIFIVCAMMIMLSLCSWVLMFKIMREVVALPFWQSHLLTFFFFSFSHVMIILFVEDHMAMTLPLLLLAIYLSGKAIKENRKMPLTQSLPLLFISTGVTTTNCVKVALADFFTRWGKESFGKTFKHFLIYLIPLSLIFGVFIYQEKTTQMKEKENIENIAAKRIQKDPSFAKVWEKEQQANKRIKANQLVKLSFVTNTDYKIDRLPSLVENVFGEGLILHSDYPLKDSNRNHRPVLVRYSQWYYYMFEAMIVLLFVAGVWVGRRERIVWAVMSMFLFDMLLHVGLNFASADVYIMTAHWAFAIPIAVGFLLHSASKSPQLQLALNATILFLALFLWVHNLQIITDYFGVVGKLNSLVS